MSNLTVNPPVVACTNLATGSGASYSLPESCGTPTTAANYTDAPLIVAAAQ